MLKQLYLLLWKNFLLRKRRKFRLFVEIFWPIFIFLITAWVRTRVPRTFESQCHYTQRTLPSGGIVPFLTSFICQMDDSCYKLPQDTFNQNGLRHLTESTIEYLNRKNLIQSIKIIFDFGQPFIEQRKKAKEITNELKLKDVLTISSDNFLKLFNLSLNETKLLNDKINYLVLNSNPNFNSLYSLSSMNYTEPSIYVNGSLNLLNLLYGSDLESIDINRVNNEIDNSEWIRNKTCTNSTSYLLRHLKQQNELNQFLCDLKDKHLESLFLLISKGLNMTKVKQKVYDNSFINDRTFYIKLIEIYSVLNDIQQEMIKKPSTKSIKINSLRDILNNFDNFNLSNGLCGDSKSSIFVKLKDQLLKTKFTKRNETKLSEIIDYLHLNSVIKLNNDLLINELNYTDYSNLFEQLNNLNKQEKCSVEKLETNLNDESSSKSCFCKTLFNTITTLPEDVQVYFKQIKPILFGKILYSPNTTEYTNLIIKKANFTFKSIDSFSKLISKIAILSDDIILKLNLTTSKQIKLFDLKLNKILKNYFNWNLTDQDLNIESIVHKFKYLNQIFHLIHNSIDCFDLNRFVGHSNEDNAIKQGVDLMEKDLFWSLITFQTNYSSTKIINYKIRMNASKTQDTSEIKDNYYSYEPKDCLTCNPYFTYGFIYIQDILEKAIVEFKTNKSQDFGITTQMTPYPCYIEDKFLLDISKSLPLFMVMAWVYTVSTMVKDVVYEKEKRLKEFMQIMGLSNFTYWLSWFISSFIVMFIVSILICFLMKLGNMIIYSDFTLLVVFFSCFTLATITQCFLISIFFNKASLASVVAGILYFICFLPYTILINYSQVMLPWQIFLVSLSSPVAFSYGAEIMATFELQAKGIRWDNINSTPFSESGFTIGTMCLILLFDSFLYLILAWYIEALYPGEFGIPKKWYFPLQKSYWFGYDNNEVLNDKKKFNIFSIFNRNKKIDHHENIFMHTFTHTEDNGYIEKVNMNENIGIEIKNLHKFYSRGNNHALKGLTVNFYENEIASFLGHNGAGKSTTMHLLTGLYKPSHGSAKINGLDISTSMEHIRKSLGFVPQQNIHFSNLTVYEHLVFYAKLKGINDQTAEIEAEKMLVDTGLAKFRDKYSKSLSGGMQRMLSISIAFIGGSKTVILDEPTAGVDVGGRRNVWDILLKYKSGRTLVISTHHLDEAELLSDRVAIISNGKLIAYGSPYYLKKKFGNGYYLTMAKKSLIKSISSECTLNLKKPIDRLTNFEIEHENEFTNNQDKMITEYLQSKIKNVNLIEANCSEITFSIPNDCDEMKSYASIFNQIEDNMERFGIESIGLSDTSLEEIFIKILKQNNSPSEPIEKNDKKFFGLNLSKLKTNLNLKRNKKKIRPESLTEQEIKTYSEYTNLRVENKYILLYQQLYALLVKRYHRVKRNVKGFLAETVLPVVFVCLALLVANFAPTITDKPSIELHPWYYETQNNLFISRNSSIENDRPNLTFNQTILNQFRLKSTSKSVNKIWRTFLERPGAGNRCLNGHKIYVNYSTKIIGNDKELIGLNCESYDFELISNNFKLDKKLFLNDLMRANYTRTKISPDCDCSSGFAQCPLSAGGDIHLRSLYKLKSTDLLHDLTGRNVTDWLIKTEFAEDFFQKRYGGFEFIHTDTKTKTFLINWQHFSKSTLNLINSLSNLVTNETNTNNDLNNLTQFYTNFLNKNSLYPFKYIKMWYNPKGYHSNVAYLNVLNNALMRSNLVNVRLDEHGIIANNHPMKFSKLQFITELEKRLLIDLFVAIFIIFALSFIPASFLVFFVEERENNSKQLQFVTGVKPYMYWIANFVWDLINYILPSIICILIFLIFDTKTFTSKENFPCLICLIFLYGWSCIPMMYPLNYLFKLSGTSFVIGSSMNIFIGVGTTTTTTVLNIINKELSDVSRINNILKTIFMCLFPHYCLGQGLLDMSFLYNIAEIKKNLGYQSEFSPFEFNHVGRNLFAMACQGLFYFTLNLLIQYKFFIRPKPSIIDKNNLKLSSDCQDDDVLNEKRRILENRNLNDYIKLINLTKIYKKFMSVKEHLAVDSISCGIKRGECFGLLGVNGAGKSTTFKMITGEETPSFGDILINGYSVCKDIENVYKNIGYCPQKNAIFPLLTAKEHLIFYARLRGIPEQFLNEVSLWALNRFGLNSFVDRIAQDYSGGNKRKLSTSIAILGNPKVICLDEPTSGMDVKVRRILWNDILSLIKENRIVILTSHSMAECESLCTRLAIMVDGQFRCLGSPQHLKNKYGYGYRLLLRINDENSNNQVVKFIEDNFEKPVLKEMNKNTIEFNLPFDGNRLSDLFGKLEENREQLNIKDYLINQTTLDQIFVNFSQAKN